MALEDGSWILLMTSHPVTKNLFLLNQWNNRHFIELSNKNLPANTLIN